MSDKVTVLRIYLHIIYFFSKEIPFLNVITREDLTFLAACLVTSLASFYSENFSWIRGLKQIYYHQQLSNKDGQKKYYS